MALVDLSGGQERRIDTPNEPGLWLLTVNSDVDGPIVDVTGVQGEFQMKITRGRGVILDKHAIEPDFDRLLVTAGSDCRISVVFLPYCPRGDL